MNITILVPQESSLDAEAEITKTGVSKREDKDDKSCMHFNKQ